MFEGSAELGPQILHGIAPMSKCVLAARKLLTTWKTGKKIQGLCPVTGILEHYVHLLAVLKLGTRWYTRVVEYDWGIAIGSIGRLGSGTAKASILLGGGELPQLQFALGSFTPAARWNRQNVTGPLPPKTVDGKYECNEPVALWRPAFLSLV